MAAKSKTKVPKLPHTPAPRKERTAEEKQKATLGWTRYAEEINRRFDTSELAEKKVLEAWNKRRIAHRENRD